MNEKGRLRAVARGRVQGVGFRWSVTERAAALGLTGYARNLVDGTVEVVAEGDLRSLAELERFMRHGPGAAVVTGLDVHRSAATGEFRGFAAK